MSTADVAVIGGGAIGAACARAAALRGLAVAIFEPGPDPAAASPASAGMLAPQIEPADDALVALSVRARDLYEPLAPALRETTGIDIGFWRSGIAAVAFDEPDAVRLKEDVARQRQAGLRCDWLEADEVRERWPGAAPECHGALFAPEDGALDPQGLTRACLSDARRLGAGESQRMNRGNACRHRDGYRAAGTPRGFGPVQGQDDFRRVYNRWGRWGRPHADNRGRGRLIRKGRRRCGCGDFGCCDPSAAASSGNIASHNAFNSESVIRWSFIRSSRIATDTNSAASRSLPSRAARHCSRVARTERNRSSELATGVFSVTQLAR